MWPIGPGTEGLGVVPLLLQGFVPPCPVLSAWFVVLIKAGHGAASSDSAQWHPKQCIPLGKPACRGVHLGSSLETFQHPGACRVQCRRSFVNPSVSTPSLHKALCCYCLLLSIHPVAVFSLSKLCLISLFPPFPPYFLGTTLSATHLSALINYPQPMITGWLCLLHVLCLHWLFLSPPALLSVWLDSGNQHSQPTF